MTLADWTALYARLCAGLSRKEAPAQMRAYFDTLSDFSPAVVTEMVRAACSRTWPPTHPTAGDLHELAVAVRRAHHAPASMCDVCHGSGWVTRMGAPQTIRMPVYRPSGVSYTEKQWQPEYAERCPQCWQRKDPAA